MANAGSASAAEIVAGCLQDLQPKTHAILVGEIRDPETAQIAIQSGNYLIGGYLHSPPGSDPIANVGERPLMVPLTDAWIEYWSGAGRTTQSIGTIIVNREQVDWMRVVTDEDLFGGLLRPAPIPDRPG